MKKHLCLILTALIALSLFGCSTKEPAGNAPADKTSDVKHELADFAYTEGKDFGSCLSVGENGDIFIALDDGTVWCTAYADGGSRFNHPNEKHRLGELYYAFDFVPKQIEVGPSSGYVIDENDVLYGWGYCVPGKIIEGHDELIKIAENVKEVKSSVFNLLILKNDGTLWLLDGGVYNVAKSGALPNPKKILDNVVSFDMVDKWFSFLLAAVTDNGEVYWFDRDGTSHHKGDDMERIANGYIYGKDGWVYELNYINGPMKLIEDCTDVRFISNNTHLALGTDGVLRIVAGSRKDVIDENVKSIVGSNEIIYIDGNGVLCAYIGNEKIIIDNDVIFAESGNNCSLTYIKNDGSLWVVPTLSGVGWYEAKHEFPYFPII